MQIAQNRFLATLEGLRHGRLRLTTPEGTVHGFGSEGDESHLEIRDWRLLNRLSARGDVGLGEAWINGDWHSTCLESLLTLVLRNRDTLTFGARPGPLSDLRRWAVDRLPVAFRRGGAGPYRIDDSIGNEFFQLWLDPGMTFSAALFSPGDDLSRAQDRKHARILSRLSAGETVLELGCGWGSFAEAAADEGRRVTGLTLSPAQKGYADARLDGRAAIQLKDFRRSSGLFDNIVSIEMIETLGETLWPAYFATLKARLAEGGRAVVQAITVPDAEYSVCRQRTDFSRRHIGPGSVVPCNAMIAREASRVGLRLRHSFSFGQDYARTCRIWVQQLLGEKRRIMRQGHDERFVRRWQFDLESSAAAFATGRADVVHLELQHGQGVGAQIR